jgi:outer membrane receptor protein involved in Fe transport
MAKGVAKRAAERLRERSVQGEERVKQTIRSSVVTLCLTLASAAAAQLEPPAPAAPGARVPPLPAQSSEPSQRPTQSGFLPLDGGVFSPAYAASTLADAAPSEGASAASWQDAGVEWAEEPTADSTSLPVPLDESAELEAAESAPAGRDEPMIVTGSRIRRPTSFAPSAAVDVVDRSQLERTGASNMADVIGSLTASQGAGFQGGGDLTTVSAGTASVNLRGLGTGATLVLINGRRHTPSGAGTDQVFADLSVIPLAAVERIELLKGGGSALYGADAVGGVVNIITRKNWEGFRAELDGQATTKWDQHDLTATGAWGVSSERGRALVSMSYFRRTELTAADRDFTRGQNISQQGNPGSYHVIGFDPANPRRRFPDPGCMNAEGSAVATGIVNGVPSVDQTCTFDFRKYSALLGNLSRANMFGSAEYDLTSHTTVFSEVLASRMRTDGVSSPSYAIPPPLPVVPADHIDNPWGKPAAFFGRPLGAESGAARNTAMDDTLRLVTGLKGDLEGVARDSMFESWGWELFGSWGVSRYSQQIQDNLREPLQTALNSCSNPNDLSRCFNPFYSAVDGTGTPNSQAVIDSFVGTYVFATEHALHTYNGGLNGMLFELPGGEVGMAIGAEVRREWRTTQADHDAEQERYGFLIGNRDSKAGRNVYSGYLELLWPFFRGVELQTAVRVEHYDDIDATTPSPFAGLTLTPSEIIGRERVAPALRRLQLRGSVTSAFRAPTVYQSNPNYAIVPTLLTLTNPPTSQFIPVQGFGNPDLDPERALVASAGLSFQPVDELLLSGEFWNYHYRDRIVLENAQQALANDEGLAATGQRDARVLRDALGNLQRVQVRQVNIDGSIVTNGFDFGATATLTGATFGRSVDAWGALSFGVQGTYTMNYEIPRAQAGSRTVPGTFPARSLPPPDCDRKSCEAAGSRNVKNFAPPIPRYRLNFPISYSNRGHMASLIAHYTSKLADDNAVGPTGRLGTVDPWTTVDLQYGYAHKLEGGRELTFRIGLYNLFDADPPRAVENSGFESLIHDPRGRMAYAKLIGSF